MKDKINLQCTVEVNNHPNDLPLPSDYDEFYPTKKAQNFSEGSKSLLREVKITEQSQSLCEPNLSEYDNCQEEIIEISKRKNWGNFARELFGMYPIFVDKSMFISDLIKCDKNCVLVNVPPRFGKTFTLDMCELFFDKTSEDHLIFDELKLKITQDDKYENEIKRHKGQHNVIRVDFSSLKANDIEGFKTMLKDEYRKIAIRFKLDKMEIKFQDPDDKEMLQNILNNNLTDDVISKGFGVISKILSYNGEKPVILFDEYDAIIERMIGQEKEPQPFINLMRDIYSNLFKINQNNYFIAVVVGVLPYLTSEITCSWNNFDKVAFDSFDYRGYFGFSQEEVNYFIDLLKITSAKPEIKKFYNGYHVTNNLTLYNSSAIYKFFKDVAGKKTVKFNSYWVNNNILNKSDVMKFLFSKEVFVEVFKKIVTRQKVIFTEKLTYKEYFKLMKEDDVTPDHILTYLYHSGFLTKEGSFLKIPNLEIYRVFSSLLREKVIDFELEENFTGAFQSMHSEILEMIKNNPNENAFIMFIKKYTFLLNSAVFNLIESVLKGKNIVESNIKLFNVENLENKEVIQANEHLIHIFIAEALLKLQSDFFASDSDIVENNKPDVFLVTRPVGELVELKYDKSSTNGLKQAFNRPLLEICKKYVLDYLILISITFSAKLEKCSTLMMIAKKESDKIIYYYPKKTGSLLNE